MVMGMMGRGWIVAWKQGWIPHFPCGTLAGESGYDCGVAAKEEAFMKAVSFPISVGFEVAP